MKEQLIKTTIIILERFTKVEYYLLCDFMCNIQGRSYGIVHAWHIFNIGIGNLKC